MGKKFELKQEHIDLISELNFKGLVSTEGREIEYRPAIDYKRPFGNSGVTYDVLQRLGLIDENGEYTEANRKRAELLLIELPVALEVVVKNKTFDPGEYEVDDYGAYYLYKGKRNLHFWQDAINIFKEKHSDIKLIVDYCMNNYDENPYSLLEELRQNAVNDYMEDALEIFEQYAVDKWIEGHDIGDYCRYCIDKDECPHGMACYGGEPIEPACSGGLDGLLETDILLEDLIKGEEK